ncbi:MAG: hypothetical protein OEW12_02930 [Deltaproteobacteria bacterium]|nr:hypothetical protein [Deltaproteobacteria bacterium]
MKPAHRGARAARLAVLWVLWVGLSGMGGGTADNGEIPIPQETIGVTLTDSQGHSMTVNRFTCEGRVYLKGTYGQATLTIPFVKIQSVRANPPRPEFPERVMTEVTLKTGETIELGLPANNKCYGVTKFGNLEIFVKDIQAIEAR